MADFTATVGNVELVSLTDGHGDMDPMHVFPASNMDAWKNEYSDLLDSENHIHPRFGTTGVRSGGKLIIVDTGLHALGWTRQQAIDYLLENSALTRSEVTAEVDRYITWPAQALSYKIGELRIKALRAKAEQALGPDFDIRAFHDVVVGNGSLAIAILEEIVDEWIAEQVR